MSCASKRFLEGDRLVLQKFCLQSILDTREEQKSKVAEAVAEEALNYSSHRKIVFVNFDTVDLISILQISFVVNQCSVWASACLPVIKLILRAAQVRQSLRYLCHSNVQLR